MKEKCAFIFHNWSKFFQTPKLNKITKLTLRPLPSNSYHLEEGWREGEKEEVRENTEKRR